MHPFCKRRWVSKRSVEVSFWVEGMVAHHECSAAESADIREQIEMVKGDLIRLKAAHRKAGHGAVVAVRKRPEGRINVWDERLRQVVLKCLRILLHGAHHFRRAERLAGEIRNGHARTSRISICHYHDHRLRGAGCDQVIENKIRMALPDPSRLVLTCSVL